MIFTFHGCQKDFGENTIDIFSQSEAKEWYYGTFIKSPEWQQSNEKGKKLPDWKNGTYRRVGNMEIVEFPLMKERKTLSIPSASKLSISDISKIADGSLSRIVFIRTSNNEIFVRELDYIPNIDFLKLKGYDISDLNVGNKENIFSGRIITKKWNGDILSVRISENGTITKTGKRINNVNLKSLSLTSATKDNCEYIVTEDYEKICFFSLDGDAVWEFLRCTEWEPTGNYSIDEYCYSDTYECDYGSTESCECQLYGIDCEGSDDSGEESPPNSDQNPDPNPCDNADSLESNTEFKEKFEDLKTKTSLTKEYGYLYKSDGYEGIDETPIEGDDGAAGINFDIPDDKIDGFIHSHYTGLLSIFSPDDLYAMAYLYLSDKMVDPNTFTAGVVTADGTQYIIMIDDLTQFQEFASNMVNNSSLSAYASVYMYIYGINSGNSNDVNEQKFLQYIQSTNTGLKLFKGDTNFDNWIPKKVDDSGNIINNPCQQ
jgi:hypothetical protein